MRADKITQRAENAERKSRDGDYGESSRMELCHPRGQQRPALVRAIHHEVDQTRMDTAANDRNPTSRKRVMRVFDDDLEEVFAGGMSLASGLGKSWLACALGHKACRENISVLYTCVPRLLADLAIAHGDARYARLLRFYRPRQTAHPG